MKEETLQKIQLEIIDKEIKRRDLQAEIQRLKAERQIILSKEKKERTYQELAEKMGMTRQRVEQLLKESRNNPSK